MKKTLIIERIKISDIVVDERFQPRSNLNEGRIREYCKRYRENPKSMPPIIVYRIGGVLYVISGFHRLQAAIEAGLEKVDVVIKGGTETEAIWEALGSNQHGLSLNSGDKKRAVIMALNAMPGQSDNAIAAQIGCSGSLVCKTRRQLMDQGRLEMSDTVTGTDGKTQTRRRKSKTNEKSARETKVSLSGVQLDLDQIVEHILTLQEHEANSSALFIKIVKGLYEGLQDREQQKTFAVKVHVYLKSRLEKTHDITDTSDGQ